MIVPLLDRLPRWLMVLVVAGLLAGAVWACDAWLFPWLDGLLFPPEPLLVNG